MKIFIKAADVSNEARPMDVAEPWLECLLEESFNQVFNFCLCLQYLLNLLLTPISLSHASICPYHFLNAISSGPLSPIKIFVDRKDIIHQSHIETYFK